MAVNNEFFETINNLVDEAVGRDVEFPYITFENFVEVGKNLLNTNGTDFANNYISALMNKIALTINTFRSYNGKYKELIRGSLDKGNTIEMIMHRFYETQSAAFTNLVDNETVDQYEIHKPKIEAKYFVDSNTYTIPITIQRVELIKAWESPVAMDNFIATIVGSVLNSNEFAREKGRIAMVASLIVKTSNSNNAATTEDDPAQIYRLVTLYNAKAPDNEKVTSDNALRSEKFIKFAVETIKKVSRKIESVSTSFNIDGIETFTPDYAKHLFVNGALTSAMDTYIYTNNYRPEYSVLKDYIMVDYWQVAERPLDIDWLDNENNEPIRIGPVLCVLCDYYSLGEYVVEQTMDVTPYNARGKYWNNWLNVELRYLNNYAANSVVFTLE